MKDQLNNEKIKKTFTKEMLIRELAKMSKRDINTTRIIYNNLEESIARLLSSANENTDVSIRLFEGITIDSTFVKEKTKVNNLTKETIVTSSKIKPKANITRNYCNKLNNHNN